MAVTTLIIGIILLGTGILGHTFFTRQKRALHPDEHKARRWVVTIGSLVAGLSVHFNPAQYGHLGGAKPFLATMWTQMLAFGAFVALGWFYRRRPDVHRPMMLLATLVMQSGSLARCPYITNLSHRAPLYVWGPVLIFGALLFFFQWALSRNINRAYLIGYAGIVVTALVSVFVGTSAGWARLTATLIP